MGAKLIESETFEDPIDRFRPDKLHGCSKRLLQIPADEALASRPVRHYRAHRCQ